MPIAGPTLDDEALARTIEQLCGAIVEAKGRLVFVSNEIGLGITPLTPEARRYVDELGRLHQAVAERCADVTLMVAGIEMPVKRGAASC
jgi:adenosylcobinamide kinase/adenosylcobinamide-phosphate guanylyltransferase